MRACAGDAVRGQAGARRWRGRGVGTALLDAGTSWARGRGLHKLSLELFPHNVGAIASYRKAGFVEEGHRVRDYRRADGALWDSIVMGRGCSLPGGMARAISKLTRIDPLAKSAAAIARTQVDLRLACQGH